MAAVVPSILIGIQHCTVTIVTYYIQPQLCNLNHMHIRCTGPEGKVRICVHLTKLNASVCWERHWLPAVEQTTDIGSMHILNVRCKLWILANSSSNNNLLSSQLLFCMVITILIGSHLASVLHQNTSNRGWRICWCTWRSGLSHDILVYGRSREEHDEQLRAVVVWTDSKQSKVQFFLLSCRISWTNSHRSQSPQIQTKL